MNLLSRLGRMGTVVHNGRLHLLRDQWGTQRSGTCTIGNHTYGLVPSEQLRVLQGYEATSSLSLPSFTQQVRGAYNSFLSGKGVKVQEGHNESSLHGFQLPNPCVLYGGWMYAQGEGRTTLVLHRRMYKMKRQRPLVHTRGRNRSRTQQATVRQPLPSFSLQHEGKQYRFDSTHMMMDVKLGEEVTLLRQPYVSSGYEHPIVWENGSICFNGDRRWGEMGVHFGKPQSLHKGVYQCARALFETRTLLMSYFGDVQKVHKIEDYAWRRVA